MSSTPDFDRPTDDVRADTDERYEDGVRTDDDAAVDPQQEVEERLQRIEEEQRERVPRHAEGVERPGDRTETEGAQHRDVSDDTTRTDDPAGPPSAAQTADTDDDGADDPTWESDEDRRAREGAFAAEHDPEDHDVAAGAGFRQAGDWTAETGQVTPEDVVTAETGADGRRLSSVEEIRDGGYGVGSAAPIADGAMPLDHWVKAWEDSKTYLVQGERGYAGTDPHVWFLDDRSAERAGFDHAG